MLSYKSSIQSFRRARAHQSASLPAAALDRLVKRAEPMAHDSRAQAIATIQARALASPLQRAPTAISSQVTSPPRPRSSTRAAPAATFGSANSAT